MKPQIKDLYKIGETLTKDGLLTVYTNGNYNIHFCNQNIVHIEDMRNNVIYWFVDKVKTIVKWY